MSLQCIALGGQVGDFHLGPLDLTLPDGAYGVLMGSSGSGKTTLLEMVAGLCPTSTGQLILDGESATHLPASHRQVGYVPQDGALFNTMTVAEHLDFGPRIRGWDASSRRDRVSELAKDLGLESLLGRKPKGLSGGERQRVALGRALASPPRLLLLDEPLAALDESAHDELCGYLERIHSKQGVCVLHVTHNRGEAERLATHRLELNSGSVRALSS